MSGFLQRNEDIYAYILNTREEVYNKVITDTNYAYCIYH